MSNIYSWPSICKGVLRTVESLTPCTIERGIALLTFEIDWYCEPNPIMYKEHKNNQEFDDHDDLRFYIHTYVLHNFQLKIEETRN